MQQRRHEHHPPNAQHRRCASVPQPFAPVAVTATGQSHRDRRCWSASQDKIKQEKLKAADLMDELERKTHQQESLEEINQQMIADMTKRMSAQIRDCPVWKETLAQLLHDTVRPSPGAAAPHPPGAPKPGFLRGLFGHKDEAGAADHRQASLERGSSDGDTSAGSRRESSVVMRRRELRKKEELGQRTASQGSSDPGLSRSGSLSLSSARSSGEFAVPPEPGALEEVAALKAQNKLLESNMHDMQRAMNQCLDQKYDEIKRKVCGQSGRRAAQRCHEELCFVFVKDSP